MSLGGVLDSRDDNQREVVISKPTLLRLVPCQSSLIIQQHMSSKLLLL